MHIIPIFILHIRYINAYLAGDFLPETEAAPHPCEDELLIFSDNDFVLVEDPDPHPVFALALGLDFGPWELHLRTIKPVNTEQIPVKRLLTLYDFFKL